MNILITIGMLLSFAGLAAAFTGDDDMLTPGTAAPAFSLPDQDGNTVSLEDFKGSKYVVLIFYPGDNTPVCTKQLCEVRDDYSAFESRNAVVLGINPGSVASHKKFAQSQEYQFPLLADTDKKVTDAYGCKGLLMLKRTVYVIDPEGKIVYAQRGKPPVAEFLEVIPEK